MLNAIANLGWVFVLFSFGVFCGICWVHRPRHTVTRGPYQGTQNRPPEPTKRVDELWQDEDEFEEVVDVFMVQDEDNEPEQAIKPPACHPMTMAMSQSQPLVAAQTLRLYRET